MREQACQRALTQKQTIRGGDAPKRGHGAALEPLAQFGDALCGVGAITFIIKAAELIVGQTVTGWRYSVNGR